MTNMGFFKSWRSSKSLMDMALMAMKRLKKDGILDEYERLFLHG